MEGYKELLDQLKGLVNSLEKGELSLEELNELETVTRTLHERSIILRYKAFEASVLGEERTTEPEPETTEIEPASLESFESVEMEAEEETQSEPEEEPAFDFAIFDEAPEEEADIEPVEMEAEEEEPAAEEPVVEPQPVAEVVEEEPVIEPEPSADIEPVEMEAEVEEETQPEPTPVPAASGGSFLDRFSQQDNSVAGRFSAGPLDSLIGAFGLNERLRFINDLFDGSSEKFSDAIKALDTQTDLDTARQKAAGYAEENEWDPEEEVVAEFMNYLNRRYA